MSTKHVQNPPMVTKQPAKEGRLRALALADDDRVPNHPRPTKQAQAAQGAA